MTEKIDNKHLFIHLGACPHAFTQATSFHIRSRCGVFMRRAPGCPLEFGSGKPVFVSLAAGSHHLRVEPPRKHKNKAVLQV